VVFSRGRDGGVFGGWYSSSRMCVSVHDSLIWPMWEARDVVVYWLLIFFNVAVSQISGLFPGLAFGK